jgi:hypothetical protein
MSPSFFDDKQRPQLLEEMLGDWCKEYSGFQREQMEEVLLRNLQAYPTERLQAVIEDIRS